MFSVHTDCIFQEKLNQNKEGQEIFWQATRTQSDVALKGEITSNGETDIVPSLTWLGWDMYKRGRDLPPLTG